VEEPELVERAQAGDVDAFTRLVAEHDRAVLRLALRYTGSEDEAADLYQETLWRAYRSLPRFRNDSRFSTWLFRIAVNVCLKRTEKQRKEAAVLEPIASEQSLSFSATTPLAGPETAFQLAEFRQRLYAALQDLSPRQRMVFVLRHFEGLPLAEIATLLKCSTGSVKKYLFAATRRLRELLQDVYQETL